MSTFPVDIARPDTWETTTKTKVVMRLIKGSVIGLVLAGMVMLAPTAFARGGGHSGGHGGSGGHFGGFAGRGSGFHGGAHYGYGARNWYGGPYWNVGWWDGDPYWWGNPYYGYYDYNAYSQAAPWQSGATSSRDTVTAVQQELARLGYYRGPVDGIMGPQTRQAIRSFQSAKRLPVTGLVDGATLKGLRIS
jgi:hypothetical protein